MPIPGTIPVTATIAPTDPLDTFPTHDEKYGKGGYRSVPTEADKLLIPAEHRTEGMLVKALDTGKYYTLAAGLVTWNSVPLDALVLTVGTVAELRTLTTSSFSTVRLVSLLGYYVAGDGGGGSLWVDVADTTSADNGGSVFVVAGLRIKALWNEGVVNIRRFGAKGDSITSDSARIQAAWDYAASVRNVGVVDCPAGVYVLTTTLQLGTAETVGGNPATGQPKMTLRGQTTGCQTLYAPEQATKFMVGNFAECTAISVADGKAIDIVGIGVDGNKANQVSTTLVGIELLGDPDNLVAHFNESLIENCSVLNVAGTGIKLAKSGCQIINTAILFSKGNGLHLFRASDPHMSWVLSGYNGGDGFYFEATGSARIVHSDAFYSGGHGLVLKNCNSMHFLACVFNENSKSGMWMEGTSGNSSNGHHFTQCEFMENNHWDATSTFFLPGISAQPTGTWANAELAGVNNYGHRFSQCRFYSNENTWSGQMPSHGLRDARSDLGIQYPGYGISVIASDFPPAGRYTSAPYTTNFTLGATFLANTSQAAPVLRHNINFGLDIRTLPVPGTSDLVRITLRSSAFALTARMYSDATTTPYRHNYYTARGTPAAPTAVLIDEEVYRDIWNGFNGITDFNAGSFAVRALQTYSAGPTKMGSQLEWQVTPLDAAGMVTMMFLNGVGFTCNGQLNVQGNNSSFGNNGFITAPNSRYGLIYQGILTEPTGTKTGIYSSPKMAVSSGSLDSAFTGTVIARGAALAVGVIYRATDVFLELGGTVPHLISFLADAVVNATHHTVLGFGSSAVNGRFFLINSDPVYRIVSAGDLMIGGVTKHASSIAQFDSTSQGVLLPRMTKAQRDAITSPADGLVVYQTDGANPGMRFRESGAWVRHNVTADP